MDESLGWGGFAADPRLPQHAGFRASDADRATVTAMLAEAFADGRLDRDEHGQRLEGASRVKTLGEIPPLLHDLVLPEARGASAALEVHEKKGTVTRRIAAATWVGLSMFFVAIWLLVAIGGGRFEYFWPMWPMLGLALPAAAMTYIAEHTYERPGRPKRPLARPVAPPMLGPAQPLRPPGGDGRAALRAAARELGNELAAEARRKAAVRAQRAAQRMRERRRNC